MNVENSLEAVQMMSHPGNYMVGLRKIMQKKTVWRSTFALERSVTGVAYSLGQAVLISIFVKFITLWFRNDRLCGLVVRVSGYTYRGPGFDPRRYQIF